MVIRSTLNSILKRFERKLVTTNLIEIHQKAILANYDLVKAVNPGSEVWPVLKSNAYGHGIQQVAQILKQRSFAYIVADSYYEALKIREISHQPVLLIGYTPPENFPIMDFRGLALAIYDLATIHALGKLGKKIAVHIKINTGMNRQGIKLARIPEFIDVLRLYPQLKLEGICSHLADADGENVLYTNKQAAEFSQAVSAFEQTGFSIKYKHLANTAGSAKAFPNVNAIRLGIGLYGFNPLHPKDPEHKKLQGLKPALRFISTITNVTKLQPGEKVSYNCTYTAEKRMSVGVLPVGYYELYDRRLSNKGFVKCGGQFFPIVGRVCMNLTVIDLQDTGAKVGDKVEVISLNHTDKNSITTMATTCGTIPYEILVKINESTRRVVK